MEITVHTIKSVLKTVCGFISFKQNAQRERERDEGLEALCGYWDHLRGRTPFFFCSLTLSFTILLLLFSSFTPLHSQCLVPTIDFPPLLPFSSSSFSSPKFKILHAFRSLHSASQPNVFILVHGTSFRLHQVCSFTTIFYSVFVKIVCKYTATPRKLNFRRLDFNNFQIRDFCEFRLIEFDMSRVI